MEIQSFANLYREINLLAGEQFSSWCFMPGMGLGDGNKWWVDGAEKRAVVHEGIDFFWYEGQRGRSHVQPGDFIPSCCDGKVVACCPDFLGCSLFVIDENFSCFVFSHIFTTLLVGDLVTVGSQLGKIAQTNGPVPPHLHVSKFMAGLDWDWSVVTWQWLHQQQIAFVSPFGG